MTREEAIEILKAHHMWTGEPQKIIDVRKENKAIEMAIQALEQTGDAVSKGVFEQVMWERDIAIEQLHELGYELGQKIEPCDDAVEQLKKYTHDKKNTDKVEISVLALNRIIKALSQEPCDDAISREAVLSKKIYTETEEGWSGYTVNADYIEHLPSVTSKFGKWIDREEYDADRWKCSICGRTEQYQERYCPSCGAKMESEDKE